MKKALILTGCALGCVLIAGITIGMYMEHKANEYITTTTLEDE